MGTIAYNNLIDPGYIFQDNGGVFSANRKQVSAFDYFPDDAAVDDALYFGLNQVFDDIQVYIGTAFAAASVTFVWEYYRRITSSWETLVVVDGTNGWTNLGQQTIGFVPPDDWWYSTVNGVANQFWVRCRVSAVDTPTEGGANSTQYAKVGNNLIVISNYPEGSPCSFDTLYQADISGGWGVVTRVSDVFYKIRARVQIGDNTNTTWLIDTQKQAYVPLWAAYTNQSGCWLDVKKYGHFRFGEVADADNKIGKNGVSFAFDNVWGPNVMGFYNDPDNVSGEFYGCSFMGLHHTSTLMMNSTGSTLNIKYWCCIFNNGVKIHRLKDICEAVNCFCLSDSVVVNPSENCTIEHIIACVTDSVGYSVGTIRNVRMYGDPDKIYYCDAPDGTVAELIDCDLPYEKFYWVSSNNITVNRKFTLNLRVSDIADNPVSGASVTIKDKNGDEITGSPFTTDENGKIEAPEVLIKQFVRGASPPTWTTDTTEYGPHSITIEKDGYQTYQDVIALDRTMDLEVALSSVPPPVYVNVPSGEVDITLASPALLGVALVADGIRVQLSED
jgi:hypothetical protein